MNINNNAKAVVTSAPRSIAQTTNHSLFDCAEITNSPETCSTIARIGCWAVAGATLGATVLGPGLIGTLVSPKVGVAAAYTCKNVALGAMSGAIGYGVGGCYVTAMESLDEMSQGARPVTTQPKVSKSADGKGSYHAVATSD